MNHHFRFFAFALVFVLISIQLASAWAPGTPDYLKCKPLPFYRFRADERHPAQFNRFAAVDPFVVRLIYFTPSDRPPRAEVPEELDTLIKQTQAFYASEMEARGYSQKSFIFEKDAAGKAIVHPVNGQFFDNHYLGDNTSDNVEAEIETQFSLEDNIYLVAVDVSDGFINNAGGVGGPRGPNGGVAVIPASGTNFDFTTVAHELGHAFGLQHDFRDDVYIMSYGDSPNRLSMCNADYLDVNRFFNPGRVFISEAEPTIRITSSLEYPPGASVIAIRFELNDPEGLHQAQFLPATTDFATGLDRAAAVGSPEVQECAGLNGQMEVIAFSYARFSGTDAHRLALGVVDLQGHTALKEFSVFSAGRIGQTLRVSQSGGTDFPSISTAVAQAFPRDLIEISDSAMYTERVEIKENLISIRALAGEQPLIEAFEIFGATGFTLENVNILDGVTDNRASAIAVLASTVTIAGNEVRRNSEPIFIQDNAQATVTNNQIVENASSGLVVSGSTATLTDNTIESSQSGVLVTDASMAQIKRNRIRNAQDGIKVQKSSEATIQDNQITDNRASAIAALASTVTIAGNEIRRNSEPIFIQDSAQATVTNNQILENASSGLVVSGSTATLMDNIIESSQNGVLVTDEATARIERNHIRNAEDAIKVQKSSEATIGDNQITDNRASAIAVLGSRVTVTGNEIRKNSKPIFIQDNAQATVTNNQIVENVSNGLVVSGSTVTLTDNEISQNGAEALQIHSSSRFTVQKNRLLSNGVGGILCQDSMGDIIGNTISQNRGSGVQWRDTKGTIVANIIATSDDGDVNQSSDHGVVISEGTDQVLLKDNTIEESGELGVLLIGSNVRAEGNTIRKNVNSGIAAQEGANLVLIGNTITENRGGGLRMSGSTAEITKNIISQNDDGDAAGDFDRAIEIANATASISIRDNVMNRNGAGVFVFGTPEVILINNLISRSRNANGHGVLLQGSSGRLINNTIVLHVAGLLISNQTRTPQVHVVNTLFAENQFDIANFDQATADSQIRHSLLADTSFIGRDNNIGDAPRFVDEQIDDFHLQSDSPAIDAGDSGVSDLPELDLDGKHRVAGDAVDIGAYEFGSDTPIPPFHEFIIEFPEGISLRHLPLAITHVNDQPRQILRISDLYDALGGDTNVYQLIT